LLVMRVAGGARCWWCALLVVRVAGGARCWWCALPVVRVAGGARCRWCALLVVMHSLQILDLAAPDPTAGVRRFAPTHPSLLTPRPFSPSRHRYHPLDLLLSHSLIPSASHSLTHPFTPFTPCTHSTLNSRHPSPHRHRDITLSPISHTHSMSCACHVDVNAQPEPSQVTLSICYSLTP
jgi:hypothetical protein